MVAIACITVILSRHEQHQRSAQLQSQGSALARVLAGVPPGELVNREHDYGPLNVLRLSQQTREFAYALVTGSQGEILNAATAPGVPVPADQMPPEASAWAGERIVINQPDGRQIREFYAPVLEDGQIAAVVRLGYFQSHEQPGLTQLAFLATIALPIFLLAPLFYLLVRREIRPIRVANREMNDVLSNGKLRVFQLEASGELRDFVSRFNRVLELAQSKVAGLQAENHELLSAQRLLEYGKRRVESVLQALPDGVIILGQNGNVTFANDRVRALLGVDPDVIRNRPPSSWCSDQQVLEVLRRYEQPGESHLFTDTVRIHRAMLDGSADRQRRHALSVRVYPLFSPQDPEVVQGQLVIFQDAERLVLAEESRVNFVAHVAHELKSPLNTLGLYAEALQGPQGCEESFRTEAYNVIRDEVERLAALVDNLLSLTKIEMGSLKVDKRRIKLRELLEDAFGQISHSVRASGLRMTLDLPPELSAVSVDKALLRVALNNLLVNAVKYTDPGGEVTLSAEETDTSIRISVRDTGIGISTGDQARIFDKFYRADDEKVRSRSGHGLGLSLAREIVEMHRGQVSVSSAPGQGSEFVIELWKDHGLMKQAI